MATNKKVPTKKPTQKKPIKAKAKPRAKEHLGRSLLTKSRATLFGGRRGFVVAGLLAIIGLVAVAFSFAAGTPNYQYTIGSQSKSGSGLDHNAHSAEGFTYLAYKGVLGRGANTAEINAWSQKLAGDRTKPSEVLATIMGRLSSGSNSAFVATVYKNFLGRKPDKKGQDYWLKQLKSGRTRQSVVLGFIGSAEVIKSNQAALLALTPATIVETARNAQAKRASDAKANTAQAKRYSQVATNNFNYAKQLRDQIEQLKNKPRSSTTQADVTAAKQKRDRMVSIYVAGTKVNYEKTLYVTQTTKNILRDAKALQSRAPDLSAGEVQKQYNEAINYQKVAAGVNKYTQQYVGETQKFITQIQNNVRPTANAQGWIMGTKSCGGSLPPCYVMNRESGGGYINLWNGGGGPGCTAPYGWTGKSPCGSSSASGKWQFVRGTWARFGGYLNAADAPESVQDAKARQVWNGGRGCSHWRACGRR